MEPSIMAAADNPKFVVKTNELAQCAEDVRVGWGLMLAAERQIAQGQADYVEGVLKAARAIVIARDAIKNDTTFGNWCSDNGFGLSKIDKDNRAALIRVGRNLPYWRTRLAEAKIGQSLRYLIKDVPDEKGIAAPAIPPRHRTKPGPKKAAEQAESAKSAPAPEVYAPRIEHAPEHVLRAADRAEALSRERAKAAAKAARNAPPPPDVHTPEPNVHTIKPDTAIDLAAELASLRVEHRALIAEHARLVAEHAMLREAYDALCAETASARPTHH
jgi:hypothetical protein